jgi:hypothetical protein
MTQTIEVNTYHPVVNGTTEITLPYYYTCGSFGHVYCCMSADMVLTTVMSYSTNKQIEVRKYDDISQVKSRLEIDMRDKLYKSIDDAVFMHMFSEAHREVFYAVNPELKPKL